MSSLFSGPEAMFVLEPRESSKSGSVIMSSTRRRIGHQARVGALRTAATAVLACRVVVPENIDSVFRPVALVLPVERKARDVGSKDCQ